MPIAAALGVGFKSCLRQVQFIALPQGFCARHGVTHQRIARVSHCDPVHDMVEVASDVHYASRGCKGWRSY
eukprot:1172732-Amphidinium_carterae.1